MANPYQVTWNPAFPVPNGSIAATFTAFGWFKSGFDTALPEFQNDAAYVAGLT